MIVRCENCGTEFGFDDRQVGEGLTVRCSVCKYVFKVESPSATPAGWQIRTTDATSFTAPDVATLREWIDEGRLHPDDQVSRTGRNWVRLGDMPEFARAFSSFVEVAPVVSPVREADPQVVAEIGPPPGFGGAARPPSGPAPGASPPPAPNSGPRSLLEHASRPQSSVSTLPPDRSVTASPVVAPQSQRPTLSPPRSVPPQAPAPVAPSRPASASASASAGSARAPERPVIPPSIHAPGGSADEDDEDEEEFEVVEEVDDEPPVAAPAREPSGPRRSEAKRQAAPEPPRPAEVDDESDDLDAFEGDRRKRRGISPGLIAFLGVIAAVGVMFGVPSIRTKLLSLGQSPTAGEQPPSKPGNVPEIAAADRALDKLGTAALARAEADLQRAIDAGKADPATTAAMKVTLADLLLSRSLLYEMAAALDADQRESFRRRAAEDRDQGKRLIDTVEGASDADRLAAVRALARLAAGRPEAEVLPMIPDAAIETQLIVKAAILWQDLDAPVPIGLVAGLSDLKQRSGLGESALALALARAGDEVAARNAAERLLVGAEDQAVALAIRARLGESASGETGDSQADEPDQPEAPTADPNVAKAPPRPGEDGGTAGTGSTGSSGGSGGSFDKLVERGCSQVKNGEAEAGIKLLMKAFDMKANDLDVLVCLGDGHAARGNNTQAVNFYDRALAQSPANIPALRGAAKLAAKAGASERAKDLYERLLAADPHNAVAKAYLAKNASQDAPPNEPDKESGG